MAFSVIDSTSDLIGGLQQFSLSFGRIFNSTNVQEEDKNSGMKRLNAITPALGGIVQVSLASIRAPINISIAMTQGFHNAPRLWGDQKVRPQMTVGGFSGGFRAGYKVRLHD
jgi:hypothetical protein